MGKAMAVVVLGIFLLATAVTASAATPADTVRVVTTADGQQMCSAVVVAPDHAYTARHCLAFGMRVDGKPAKTMVATAPIAEDLGFVYVPGLECPCASIGERPKFGDTVVAVGFPIVAEGRRVVSPEASVQLVDRPIVLAPWITNPLFAEGVFILTDKPIIDHGDSGGGLFALQDGKWKLIGINSIGVPAAPGYDQKEQASGFVPVDLL